MVTCLGRPAIELFGTGDVTMWRLPNQAGFLVQSIEKNPFSPCLQWVSIFPKRNYTHEIRAEPDFNCSARKVHDFAIVKLFLAFGGQSLSLI
jgi:hypothetical protein